MRKTVLMAAVATSLALAAVVAIAAIGPPAGKYKGRHTELGYGSGSAHKVSFRVSKGKLRRLVIGTGNAYCYPARVRQPGFAPGYFDAPSPRLRRFPPARLGKRNGRYYLRVTYTRTGKRWKLTRKRGRKQGPGYVALRGSFKGRGLRPRGRVTFRVRYGADAEGRPIYRRGTQQCIFEGKLRARRR